MRGELDAAGQRRRQEGTRSQTLTRSSVGRLDAETATRAWTMTSVSWQGAACLLKVGPSHHLLVSCPRSVQNLLAISQ